LLHPGWSREAVSAATIYGGQCSSGWMLLCVGLTLVVTNAVAVVGGC